MVSDGDSCTCSSLSTTMISTLSESGGAETEGRAVGPAGVVTWVGVGLPITSVFKVLLILSISVARIVILCSISLEMDEHSVSFLFIWGQCPQQLGGGAGRRQQDVCPGGWHAVAALVPTKEEYFSGQLSLFDSSKILSLCF